MADTDRRTQARIAVQRSAAALGLPTVLIILSERWNTVARLGDSNVIAKAATLADLARIDPARWFQQELDVCGQLAANGAPVQTPFANEVVLASNEAVPVTLWDFVPGDIGEATEHQLVDSLAELHRLGSDVTLEQPWFATITAHFPDVFEAYRDRDLVDALTITRLDHHYQRLMNCLATFDLRQGFIHGDAQRKNAILSGDNAVWIDFEECSIGPLAWDLACLSKRAEFDTDRILDRYAQVSGTNRIPNEAIDILQELRDLEAMTWMIAIQEERDHDFRKATAEMLNQWRTSVG